MVLLNNEANIVLIYSEIPSVLTPIRLRERVSEHSLGRGESLLLLLFLFLLLLPPSFFMIGYFVVGKISLNLERIMAGGEGESSRGKN